MKLYYAKPSPFVRKVHMAAIEAGLGEQIELTETLVAPGRENEHYENSVNPLRKIPALELEDGSILFDSMVISEYLNEAADNSPLVPVDPAKRWKVLTGHSLANGIMEATVLIRYETFLRPEQYQWDVWIDEQWKKVSNGLNWFEQGMDTSTHDSPLTIDQIALACALGYLDFRNSDYAWRQSFSALARWHAVISQREAYKSTAPEG